MTWSNVLTLSTANCSTVNASSIVTNSIGANVVTLNSTLSVSTLTARTVNYSSITGSSISTNAMTLSLTNVSTQNTQIYQVATTNPTTSYTVIQASHVSTGTTNNALALNPSGGNVGVGTTAPGAPLHVNGIGLFGNSLSRISFAGGMPVGEKGLWMLYDGTNNYGQIQSERQGIGYTPLLLNPNGSNVGIGTTNPLTKLQVVGSGGSGNPLRLVADIATNEVGIGFYRNPDQTIPTTGDMWVMGLPSWGAGDRNFSIGCNNNNSMLILGANGAVYLPRLTTNGTVATTGSNGYLTVSSDRRIKENIVYQSDTQQGLASVLNLKPATYTMIGSSGSYLGFIAQDLEQEIPLAVDGKKYEWQWEEEDGKPKFDANGDIVYKVDADGNRIVRPRGVSDRAIIATQTLAIQELSKKLDATQQQLAAKSAALDSLIAWAQTQGYSASS